MSEPTLEDKFSRQLFTIGATAQEKLLNSCIKIVSDNSYLKFEVIKNLLLLGVNNLKFSRNVPHYDFLRKLNTSLNVNPDIGSDLQIYLFTDETKLREYCKEWGKSEKKRIIGFVKSSHGMLFNDFKEHTIEELDDQEYKPFNIISVDKNQITCMEKHELEKDDIVKIGDEEFIVFSIVNNKTFTILNVDDLEITHKTGIKSNKPETVKFKELADQIENPDFHFDFTKPDLAKDFHDCLFNSNKQVNEQDNEFTKKFKCNMEIPPMNSIMGALVANEAMKCVTNKYKPFQQFYYFADQSFIENGYIPYIDKIKQWSIFTVGAGAIGCELMKNFALMNVGEMTVTDMDIIELSNLNRQFLFHKEDIGKNKSDIACKKIKEFNKSISVNSMNSKMCRENENEDFERFFTSFDIIANALDNIEARLYIDQLCVRYDKPLLESGTLGSKGNTQIIVPYLTENYGNASDPSEESFPVCTIKTFPTKIEHTLQWAREIFEEVFNTKIVNVKKYVKQEEIPREEMDKVLNDVEYIVKWKPNSVNDCYKWAIYMFNQYNYHDIVKLTKLFPKDHLDSDGTPYWGITRKFPNAVLCNETHSDYLNTIAFAWASVWNIEFVKQEITNEFIANFDIKYDDNQIQTKEDEVLDKKDQKKNHSLDELIGLLDCASINSINFDKDNDFCVNILKVLSNSRADIYDIPTIDLQQTKLIGGKIKPAIITTTSLVAGLISLEMYKLINEKYDINNFYNYFVNLSVPLIASSNPLDAPKVNGRTVWDKSIGDHKMTPKDFIRYWNDKLNIKISMIMADDAIIYDGDEEELDKHTTFENLIKSESDIEGGTVELTLFDDESDDTPTIIVKI